MQKAYIDTLYSLAATNKEIISITADNGTDYDFLFERDLPKQFINVGIAEQSMVGIAAGMSDIGYIPFITTATPFLLYRAYEFIRNDICIPKRNVKMFASGGGVSISNLGPTHHGTEDIALLRSLSNLTILTPSTPLEMCKAVKKAYRISGPVYIRGEMSGEKEIEIVNINCKIINKERNEIVIFTYGSMCEEAINIGTLLEKSSISSNVYSINQLEPIDRNRIVEICLNTNIIVTLEDHIINGGIGTLMSEIITNNNINVKLLRFGYKNYVKGYGNKYDIRKNNGLSCRRIVSAIKKALKNE